MILSIIISFILFEYFLDNFLSYLNQRTWPDQLNSTWKDFYTEEQFVKAKNYSRTNFKFSLISGLFSLLLILFMLLQGGFALLDEWVKGITNNIIGGSLLFFGVIYIASDIINLPFSIYKLFVIEEKFGFNRMTIKTFISDKIKGYILTSIVGGGLLTLFIIFYQFAGEVFWIYAWILFALFSLFFAMFYTSLIVPLFNKLSPLETGELRTAIEHYAKKVNFSLKNIFVVDGSKRSSKANAYFSGMGAKKSIVLYDTLIKEHSTDELVSVLAHEVGHYKKKHIQQSYILSIAQMGIILYILSLFINNPGLSTALGVNEPTIYINLLAFGLLYSPISILISLFMNIFSRKNEFEADHFAKLTANSTSLQSALKRLSTNHLSNLTPHPLYVFFNYSHPPLLKRLKALNK